jgi:hypothetical protein
MLSFKTFKTIIKAISICLYYLAVKVNIVVKVKVNNFLKNMLLTLFIKALII